MLDSLRRIVQEVSAAEDLTSVLEIIVGRVRDVMGTEVCSIYLYDPQLQRLIFSATEGLNKAFVGKLSMSPNEGLVGQVARREEPINLEDAQTHPSFLFMPGIGEERYSAFLGVPITHQRDLLGVLIVQQQARRRFDENEEAFLVTISAQLAAAIAHAQASGAVTVLPGEQQVLRSTRFDGVSGAGGVGIGHTVVVSAPSDLYAVPFRRCKDIDVELAFFASSLDAVRADIRALGERLAGRLPPAELALFDVYLRMLDDQSLASEVNSHIQGGESAASALSRVVRRHVRNFELMEDPYFNERAVDVKDLGRRVLAYLQEAGKGQREFPERTVLIGEELTASVLGEVPEGRLVALVSVRGSSNSHVAILARAMGIPAVMGVIDLPFTQLEGAELIVDGYQGHVHCYPGLELRQHFEAIVAEDLQFSRGLEALRELPCETTDSHRLPLWVNTGLVADVMRSLERGAEGVGLYRTEIPFLLRERFPSEEEQRQIYREQLQAFAPMPVTMRTLDIGGDKALPYFPIKEDNPFLGWRGIRVTLDHPEIFLVQVRAMMKANLGLNNLRIMLPMISSVPELEEALELIYRAHDELVDELDKDLELPMVGVMVEVPAAVYQARELARRVNFLSVGSNDLTQYLLAVDRNNARVADLYHAYHPAVLRALQSVVTDCHAEGKKVGICGELAGDPAAAILLMAMGYDMLSMSATNLPRVKSVLRGIALTRARELLDEVMQVESSEQVRELLEATMAEQGIRRRRLQLV